MDFDLTDEQELVRRTARNFTDSNIVDRARDNDRNEHFDLELVTMMAKQGYLGAVVPRQYGGAGLDYITYALLVEEIGRGCSSMRTVISVQTSLVCSSILRWGTEDQKLAYLPLLCSGEWLGCFGLTEPDTGSDAANQKTVATKTDGGWSITGRKMWISLGSHAKVALIFAQTDPSLGHRGIACFLVETDTEGFSTSPIHHKMGLRGCDTAELMLDNVVVGDDALMGEVGEGFKIAMSALDNGRYSVAAGCVGVCQGSLEASVDYSTKREQFGKPIASFQLVQQMLAEIKVSTEAARLLVLKAGDLKDKGRPSTTETSIAKWYATEAAVRCADTAIQVHGGSGYVDDYPVERYLRDVRVTTLYEGTSQIQQLIIGRDLTGINALVPPQGS
ncbi:MAG: acyl-CoA dehydrogenase [Actinobacteria bacterium]|nr:acyl-CoA dehydrogenase [Actinomycetota bacterium]